MGLGAVDPERRRIAAPVPGQGRRRRAGRPTASGCCIWPKASRRGRSSSSAGSTPTARRRRSRTSPKRRATRSWSPDGKSIAFSMFVAATRRSGRSACRPSRRARSGRRRRASSSTIHYRQDQVGYLEDGYTHLFVVPADGGTPRAADDRQVERRRGRAARRRVDRLDARQQVDRVRRQPRRPTPTCSTRRRSSTSSTSRPARSASSWRRPARGAGRSCRPTAGPSRSPATRRPAARTPSAIMYVIPITGGVGRHAQDQRRLRSRSDQPALGARRHRRCTSTPTIAARATSSSRRSSAASSR